MKTLREETVGKARLRLLQTKDGYAGVVIKDGKSEPPIRGEDPDELWSALERAADKAGPSYFGYDGAQARFLKAFPEGFRGADYTGLERDYKIAVVDYLADALPLETALNASADDCVLAARAYGKTNLLSLFEQARIREVLKGPDGPKFLAGAARFAEGDYAGGIREMIKATRPSGSASWPVMTYLPFFWRPAQHMFLKPTVTVDFASRVGHRFARDYKLGFEAAVYQSLLDMTAETERELAALSPRDHVDLQSFIWVIGAYTEADMAAAQAG